MANNDLLEETMAWIEAHPDEHNQDVWMGRTNCGTSYCFAGVTVHLIGGTPIWDGDDDRETAYAIVDEAVRRIGDVATERLYLTSDQRSFLFYGASTVDELRDAVEEIKADANWSPGYDCYEGE